ncbi:MAG: ATP-dependent Clp protease adapter protein ClpS [Phycisphaerae bacterium]|nr:ATP-dependent Clp protease adapter protein ClpS [Phycisphaerae bacterium]
MGSASAYAAEPAQAQQSRKQPRYQVILVNDDDHTYDYVMEMVRRLFGYAREMAYQLAYEVDHTGRVILDTTTLERAEFKRDQIHAYGRDWRIARCQGSMLAEIQAVED